MEDRNESVDFDLVYNLTGDKIHMVENMTGTLNAVYRRSRPTQAH
jgi:hypothetical protein